MQKQTWELTSSDPLTKAVLAEGIKTWAELCSFVRHLPYGRNSNRESITLVFEERKGSCSSKHAFLKQMADHQLNHQH